ncbi:peptidyl-prolyl cis-trans isomerase [Iamia sp.]|uniref:peptidyl-prolyl cis-trans isomerase n=1 Tax=Iamia sp. TaxID=2722710 RepID=UPI002C711B63|nr:peptidyl-prolyl cis-trans isomerase [Iamia sp.]HXH56008.1 peptidyl-prolyl cis-trans isomerase [Iamia sp.]
MASLRSPRTRSVRSAVAAAALMALVLGATACNPGRPPAATVGDTDISGQRVDDILDAYLEADAEMYGESIEGDGDDTLQMEPVASLLSNLVLQTLQSNLAAERGVEPTEAERTEAEQQVTTSFVSQTEADPAAPEGEVSEAEAASTEIFDALAPDTREWLVDLRADSLALTRVLSEENPPDEEAARQFYEENPAQFASVCLRLLVVAEDGLDAARARLDAGEDFGDVSAEISTDPAVAEARGVTGECTPLSQLQQQLQGEAFEQIASSEVGGVSGPFAYDDQGNVVLVEVQDIQLAPFEDVRDTLLQQLPAGGEAALGELIEAELAETDVRIDPRYGRWDAEQGTVIPPTGPVPDAPTAPVPPPGAEPPATPEAPTDPGARPSPDAPPPAAPPPDPEAPPAENPPAETSPDGPVDPEAPPAETPPDGPADPEAPPAETGPADPEAPPAAEEPASTAPPG